jgi:chromosome partitioning protein
MDVAPGHVRLSELEGDLLSKPEKGFILREAFTRLQRDYDYIMLDCPPHAGILLVNALVASDLLIIPIQTDFLALHGLKLLFDTIKTLNRTLDRHIVYRTLPTMYDRRAGACTRVLEVLALKMGDAMFETVIPVDTRFREASALGKLIYDFDEQSRGAKAYWELAEEVLTLW